jgi:hypothetical protein
MSKNRGESVFTVRFDGLEVPDEWSERIAASVRRAVLSEMAELDLGIGMSVRGISAEDGPTKGIVIVAEPQVFEL